MIAIMTLMALTQTPGEQQETPAMTYLRGLTRIPATESSLGVVLSMCVVAMGLMSIALVWQAQIIADQRAAIRWLEALKLGS